MQAIANRTSLEWEAQNQFQFNAYEMQSYNLSHKKSSSTKTVVLIDEETEDSRTSGPTSRASMRSVGKGEHEGDGWGVQGTYGDMLSVVPRNDFSREGQGCEDLGSFKSPGTNGTDPAREGGRRNHGTPSEVDMG